MDKNQAAAPANDLASRIYVELVSRNTEINEGAVKMKASAANLAALSIKLADAFAEAQREADAARAPVKSYKLEGADIGEWSK